MTTQTEWVPGDTFGARLILLRQHMGHITVEEAAQKCGLKTATWSTWERGASPRNMSAVVAQIALATGVSRNWLMWGGPLADPAAGGRHPNGPSDLLGQRASSDNATELMQYRYSVPRGDAESHVTVKVRAA